MRNVWSYYTEYTNILVNKLTIIQTFQCVYLMNLTWK